MKEIKPYLLDAVGVGLLILAVQFRTLTAITGDIMHLYAAIPALAGASLCIGFSIGHSMGYDERDMIPNRLLEVTE